MTGKYMKKISVLLIVLLTLASCSIQEKMNTKIFVERFLNAVGDEITADEILFDSGRDILFFADKNGTEYVMEFRADEQGNIKKICLACTDADKTDLMKYFFEKIISVYAPDENTAEIIPSLFNNKWDYHSTQWYDYSSVISDEGVFASVENKKLSTPSDAELTLKQNDIIYR